MAIIPERPSKFKEIIYTYGQHILGTTILILGIIACSTIWIKTQTLKSGLAALEADLATLNTGPDAEFIRNYEKLERSVKRLEDLTRHNISSVKVLGLIRELTNPGTTWSQMSFDSSLSHITLKGAVPTGTSAITQIGMQSESFENRKEAFPTVVRTIDPIRKESSYAGFSLELSLDQKFFTSTP